MDWQKTLNGVMIGENFASNPSDEEKAFELLGQLRDEGVGWATLEAAVRERLGNRPDVEQQVQEARRMFEPWLLD